jgi:mannose-6-phosphate isomerase-like protein (cupin superfamily)
MDTLKSYSIHDLSRFTFRDRSDYESCARTAPWGLGKWPEHAELLAAMRKCIPVSGKNDWIKDIHVLVEKGEQIKPHAHGDEWTAVFYVDPGDPVCAIIINGERVEPKRGDCIVISPGVIHAVEKSKSARTRISFAMLVEG